jgi:hypothetical protein
MYRIVIGIIVLVFFVGYSRKPDTTNWKFSVTAYHQLAEKAFFSHQPSKKLRLLRNEIFARHGRKFASKDLRTHFEHLEWYVPRKNYNDSLLSAPELEFIQWVNSLEVGLATALDSVLDRINLVRFIKDADTTILRNIDYTGDGVKERHSTAISRRGNSVYANIIIARDSDTLHRLRTEISFAPDNILWNHFKHSFSRDEAYSNYINAIKFTPPKNIGYHTDENGLPKWGVFLKLDENSTRYKAITAYLEGFTGAYFHIIISEAGECAYFWYAPENKFLEFYCP